MNTASLPQSRRAASARAEVYASFALGSEEFALAVQHVQEVVNTPAAIVPLPLAPDFVCGFFDLRGAIIPLVDMARLLGRPAGGSDAGRKTVVVDHHGVRLGLLFDDTRRVIRAHADDRAAFDYAEGTDHGVVSGVLRAGDSLVRLLDLARLAGLGGVPHTTRNSALDQAARAGRARRRCVSFRVGTAQLAFPIGSIFEIVPAKAIEPSPLQDRLCVGVMRMRTRIVPVIRLALLLGGDAAGNAEGAGPDAGRASASDGHNASDNPDGGQRVIVLELGDAYVGLLVDAVEAIDTYAQDDLMPVPVLSQGRARLFVGCVDFGPRGHVFLLDGPGVLALDDIGRVLGQQGALFKATAGGAVVQRLRGGMRQPFLWIQTQQEFALPMKAVREIVDAQDRLVPMPGAPDCVPGMINLRGQMVPVVDMRAFYRLGGETPADAETKIVVLDQGEALVGLRVDAVRSILQVEPDSRIPVPQLMRLSLPVSMRSDVGEVIQASQPAGPGDAGGQPVHLLLLDCARLFNTLTEPAADTVDV